MQHSHADRPVAARPVLIDVDGEPLGVVVRDGERFRFLAVKLPVFAIDGNVFDTVAEAQAAAQAAVASGIIQP